MTSRRSFLAASAAASLATRENLLAQSPKPVYDTHIHLFAADQQRFPFHKNAPYQPKPETLENYNQFALASGINGAVIVHPEPYQDDHRYLEYCLQNEPKPNFFRGTLLLDPLNPRTPDRLKEFTEKFPGKIKTLRIHRLADPSQPPTTMGAIRDRDLESEAVKRTVRALAPLKLMLQLHSTTVYSPQLTRLAEEAFDTTVIIDHICRAGQGTEEQFEALLRMQRKPNVVIKVSGLEYSSQESWPHKDVVKYLRRIYDTYGPGRMIWGGLGYSLPAYRKSQQQFDELFAFASSPSKDLIRGIVAGRLFGWSA